MKNVKVVTLETNDVTRRSRLGILSTFKLLFFLFFFPPLKGFSLQFPSWFQHTTLYESGMLKKRGYIIM